MERWVELLKPDAINQVLPSLEPYLKTSSDYDTTDFDDLLEAKVAQVMEWIIGIIRVLTVFSAIEGQGSNSQRLIAIA